MRKLTDKFCLGTVQFGMQYGVNNALGRQPTDAETFAVLDTALSAGVRMFDTASAYGTSEDVLGRYGLARKGAHLVSKLAPGTADCTEAVLAGLHTSLHRLDAEQLFCYMLHRADDLDKSGIMDGMCATKDSGLTKKIGVSIYDPRDAMRAAQDDRIDVIQVPYNVLDQRLDGCSFFTLAKEHGKIIFARSVFLQGLLLMQPQEAERQVEGSGRAIACFHELARDCGCSPAEAALLYTLSHPYIDYVVFGVDTPNQLLENVRISQKETTAVQCYRHLRGVSFNVPARVVQPNLW